MFQCTEALASTPDAPLLVGPGTRYDNRVPFE